MSPDLLSLKGIGPKTKEKLSLLNIYTIQDLFMFFPSGYLDLDAAYDISNAEDGKYAAGELIINRINNPIKKGRRGIIKVLCQDKRGYQAEILWYNSNYISKTMAPGERILCYGKVKKGKVISFTNPIYKRIKDKSDESFSGIRSIYPTKGLIPQLTFINFVKQALEYLDVSSVFPKKLELLYDIAEINEAVRFLHFPETLDKIDKYKKRILMEERVRIICAFRLIRDRYIRGHSYSQVDNFLEKAKKMIPFDLTHSQSLAIINIINILTHSNFPLNSILIGDVGSGKTIVAALIAYFAVLSKHQVALLAPTEILAAQHFFTFKSFFEKSGVNISLLTGSMPKEERKEIWHKISEGGTDIVVGTHSIIQEKIEFKDLSLVINDEQHKFGVAQRTALLEKGIACDLLSLSATPIPRSMNIMMLENIDVFHIESRTKRDNIKTSVVPPEKRKDMFEYVVSKCQNGAQAFVVVPRIYDVEGIECDSLYSLAKEMKAKYGNRVRISTLHGKMSSFEKEEKMDAFRKGCSDILLATSLVEVGVDIPKASIMVVMNADRFGLASLHQLRGRIGRNGEQAFCFLYTDNEIVSTRLNILTKENNGEIIAEKDCELRGMGEVYSESQSGTGCLQGLDMETLRICSEIAKQVKLEEHYEVLYNYIDKYSLRKVSLN